MLNLQSLTWYSPDKHPAHGYRCSLCKVEIQEGDCCLKIWTNGGTGFGAMYLSLSRRWMAIFCQSCSEQHIEG